MDARPRARRLRDGLPHLRLFGGGVRGRDGARGPFRAHLKGGAAPGSAATAGVRFLGLVRLRRAVPALPQCGDARAARVGTFAPRRSSRRFRRQGQRRRLLRVRRRRSPGHLLGDFRRRQGLCQAPVHVGSALQGPLLLELARRERRRCRLALAHSAPLQLYARPLRRARRVLVQALGPRLELPAEPNRRALLRRRKGLRRR